MSSVAVLTPESFAEHRSGLKDQEIPGTVTFHLYLLDPLRPTPALSCFLLFFLCVPLWG